MGRSEAGPTGGAPPPCTPAWVRSVGSPGRVSMMPPVLSIVATVMGMVEDGPTQGSPSRTRRGDFASYLHRSMAAQASIKLWPIAWAVSGFPLVARSLYQELMREHELWHRNLSDDTTKALAQSRRVGTP
jgi:hypothetical protein